MNRTLFDEYGHSMWHEACHEGVENPLEQEKSCSVLAIRASECRLVEKDSGITSAFRRIRSPLE
jgi:hypothetical protein